MLLRKATVMIGAVLGKIRPASSDSGVGGAAVSPPFLGGVANGQPAGFFYCPRGPNSPTTYGDQVVVAHENYDPGGVAPKPVASICMTDQPQYLPPLQPGECWIQGVSGQVMGYMGADGTAWLYRGLGSPRPSVSTFGTTFSVANMGQIFLSGSLTFTDRGAGTHPSIAAGASLGAGGTFSLSQLGLFPPTVPQSTNTFGRVFLHTGTGSGLGDLATITYGNPVGNITTSPTIFLAASSQANGANTAKLGLYAYPVLSGALTSYTGFTIACTVAPVDGTSYDIGYLVVF